MYICEWVAHSRSRSKTKLLQAFCNSANTTSASSGAIADGNIALDLNTAYLIYNVQLILQDKALPCSL